MSNAQNNDKLDAERYRYLRNTKTWDAVIWDAIDFIGHDQDYEKALDDAVDAAIKASKT
jgi:hypothetical protein